MHQSSLNSWRKIVPIITVIGILTIFSCEKDNLFSSQKHSNGGAQILPRSVADPTLATAGYLLFDDRDHLTGYYAYLVSVTDTASDISVALLNIISRLGHQALFYSDTAAFASPSKLAITDASICDPLRKAILNSHYEVGIGDSLFVFQNRWEIYSFPLTDTQMRDTLRASEKGTLVDQFKWTSATRLVNSEPVAEVAVTQRGVFCTQINRIYRASPCDRPLSVLVIGGAAILGIGSAFDMDIDWGDGSSTIDNSNLGIEVFDHTYSAAGTFTIVAILNTSCSGSITFTSAADVTVGEMCDHQSAGLEGWLANGTIGMNSEIWTANDPFGTHAGAKTSCYQFINSKWRDVKGTVSAHIDADFRDQECGVEDTDGETDSCGNCKSKKATVPSSTVNKYHVTGDLTSTHSITRNSITLNNSLELVFDCD